MDLDYIPLPKMNKKINNANLAFYPFVCSSDWNYKADTFKFVHKLAPTP